MERNEMTEKDVDFSFQDRPEILKIAFYPRKSSTKPSKPNARNYFIEVDRGVKIGCRFYTTGVDFPSMLYFHGNGEIAARALETHVTLVCSRTIRLSSAC